MKKKIIALRNFLNEQKEGEKIDYNMVHVCKYVSDEADNCAKDEKDKNKQHKHFQKLLKTNRKEALFIRLLFIDFLLLNMK